MTSFITLSGFSQKTWDLELLSQSPDTDFTIFLDCIDLENQESLCIAFENRNEPNTDSGVILIHQIDSEGNVQNSIEILDPDYRLIPFTIKKRPAEGFTITSIGGGYSSDKSIIKALFLNPDLEIEGESSISFADDAFENFEYVHSVKLKDNKEVIILHSELPDQVVNHTFILDNQGQISTMDSILISEDEYSESNFIFSLTDELNGTGYVGVGIEKLIRFDSQLNAFDTIAFPVDDDAARIQTANNEYVLSYTDSASLRIIVLDENFNIVKQTDISEDQVFIRNNDEAWDNMVITENEIYISFTYREATSFETGNIILKLDTNLQEQWRKTYPNFDDDRYFYRMLAQADDSGISLLGYFIDDSEDKVYGIIYNIAIDGTVSIEEINPPQLTDFSIQNPSTLFSYHNQSKLEELRITIFDMNGKKVMESPIFDGEHRMATDHLNTAAYFFHLTQYGKVVHSGKWIKH